MMDYQQTLDLFENVDIYVIDQILKRHYQAGQSILDAGCGGGRNLRWFYKHEFEVYGIDSDAYRIGIAQTDYPKAAQNFVVGTLDDLPYAAENFDHIICSAVLHFARSEAHFQKMMQEMLRVLKPSGSLLIRVASDIGLDGKKPFVQDGQSAEVGGFYITREIINDILFRYRLTLLEPIKTTNVQDVRAMTTLVLQKN